MMMPVIMTCAYFCSDKTLASKVGTKFAAVKKFTLPPSYNKICQWLSMTVRSNAEKPVSYKCFSFFQWLHLNQYKFFIVSVYGFLCFLFVIFIPFIMKPSRKTLLGSKCQAIKLFFLHLTLVLLVGKLLATSNSIFSN